MIKLVSVLRRRPDLAVEVFRARWREVHAALVCRLPGLRRYVQSHTLAGGYRKGEPAADGIAELWFDDIEALGALEGSAALARVRADEAAFLAPGGVSRVVTVEHVIKDGDVPDGGVKNVELVTRKPGLSVAAFQRHWREVHGPLGAAIPTVERYVQSHAHESAYRRGRVPAFDGFALTWFADTDAMRASARSAEYRTTRADEANFVAPGLPFIITREHVVLA